MDDAPAASGGRRIKVKKQASSGCPPLPEEIVEDILSRLPARSLCRFQCVSRSFRALISSRAFHDTHYQRHSGRRLFIRPPGVQEPFYAACPSWRRPGGGGVPAAVVVETIKSARGGGLPQGSILPVSSKSCRGLVLLRNTNTDGACCTVHVWNPSTGETLALPDSSSTPLRARWSSQVVSYGLGYCSATRRHKVVRVYDACGYDDGYGYGTPPDTICEVFTLHESAYWRPVVVAGPPPHRHRESYGWRQGGVLWNGNVHFLDRHGGVIAVFNVEDEAFGTLNTPPELQRQCQYQAESTLELTELGGSLCIYTVAVEKEPTTNSNRYHVHVDVWMLRDYDGTADAAEWEKLRRIAIGCRRDDDDDGPARQAELAMMLKRSSSIVLLDMLYHDDASTSNNNQEKTKMVFATGACDVFVVDPGTGAATPAFSPKDTAIGECRDAGRRPAVGLFEESLARVGSNLSENTAFASPSMRAWSEVLLRLPARTVWNMDRVCRGWRAMIKSHHFAAAHLHRANQVSRRSPPHAQVMFAKYGTPYTFEPPAENNNDDDTPYVVVPPVVDSSCRVICSKPCHGLNACSFDGYDFVCNPATGYRKALPPPPAAAGTTTGKCRGLYSTYDDFVHMGAQREEDGLVVGLGYEQETSSHVLVRFVYKERNLTTRGYKVVCSMRYLKDMVWEEVDPPPRPPLASMPPCHVNGGKLYWMVDTELGSSSGVRLEIVALDVSTRKFDVLQGPPCANIVDHGPVIIELQGTICVVCSHRSTGILEIWAMEDIAAGVWSVRYNIALRRFAPEYSPDTTMPLALDPKDGRILLSTGRALGYYNPMTEELETICRLGKHAQGMKFVPVLFQESLVNPCMS